MGGSMKYEEKTKSTERKRGMTQRQMGITCYLQWLKDTQEISLEC